MRISKGLNNKGTVLIFALWVLGFLAVIALNISYGIKGKIGLAKRLQNHSQVSLSLAGAVKMAAVFIAQETARSNEYNVLRKVNLHNNPAVFGGIELGDYRAEVSYIERGSESQKRRYGVVDEESKININATTAVVLGNLIEETLHIAPERADRLARDILNWRNYGESDITGFYSNEYYNNLEFPYPKKSTDYELIDELLLVKGVDSKVFDQLRRFLTVWGQGKVNINTAPFEVLVALGFSEDLVNKILAARRGKDGVEGTLDDHIFLKTYDVASEVNSISKLTPQEMLSIDEKNAQGVFTVDAQFFTIEASAFAPHADMPKAVRAVFSARENKIIYWNEK